MKKKICSLLLVPMLFIFVATMFTTILAKQGISAFADSTKSYLDSILNEKNIEDHIEKDSVIVTLTESETKKLKTYSAKDFEEVGCIAIENLTQFSDDYAKAKALGNSTKESLVETENYTKILKLNLNKEGTDNVINAIKVLSKREDILVAGPNYIYTLDSTPNDALWGDSAMWGLNGKNGIQAESAWSITTGYNYVTVGVMDTGIQADHPDLRNKISSTGHVDCTVDPIATVGKNDLTDPGGHGTHVAGIIGAQANNSIGVCGACWNTSLVSIRVFDENGRGTTSNIARAITYAASQNIPILNYSGGGTVDDLNVRSALNKYKGLFVCSAGNGDNEGNGIDNDKNPYYPSNYSFSSSSVISVGAINKNGNRRRSSNYGAKTVSIYAPGGEILSTYPQNFCTGETRVTNTGVTRLACETEWSDESGTWEWNGTTHRANGYHIMSGTSMAAPYVTGVAALMLSVDSSLTGTDLKELLLDNADSINIDKGTVKKLNAEKVIDAIFIRKPNYNCDTTSYLFAVKYDITAGKGGDRVACKYSNTYNYSLCGDSSTYTYVSFPNYLATNNKTYCDIPGSNYKTYDTVTKKYSYENIYVYGTNCQWMPTAIYGGGGGYTYVPTSYDQQGFIWEHGGNSQKTIIATICYEATVYNIKVDIPWIGYKSTTVTINGFEFSLRTGPNKCSIKCKQSNANSGALRFAFATVGSSNIPWNVTYSGS